VDTKDTANPEAMRNFRDATGVGALLFDPGSLPRADTALFDPVDAEPVAVGGRGAAWFVRTDAGEAVLRH
jgi:3-deoxy-D-manno-octulosonic acid kinase